MTNSSERKGNPQLLFRKILIARYEYDRSAKNQKRGIEHFLQYLIDHNIIESITMQRYTILFAFQAIYEEQNYHKTNTVKALAKRFSMSERQIWTILKTHSKRYQKNNKPSKMEL